MPPHSAQPLNRRDAIVATSCGLFVAFMVGAAYAAVPLYDWFCRTTGFNGTTQVATSSPGASVGRKVTVRFDANLGPGLPWRFEPEQNSIEVKLGEVVIGTVGSVAGADGLALVRLDRVAEALDAGQTLTAGGQPVAIDATALARYRESVASKPAAPL